MPVVKLQMPQELYDRVKACADTKYNTVPRYLMAGIAELHQKPAETPAPAPMHPLDRARLNMLRRD